MKMNLHDIMLAAGAVGNIDPDIPVRITSIATDSRLVQPGDLFVCLEGEQVDGHAFAEQAARAGAAAILSQKHQGEDFGVPLLLVPDTLVALGRIASYWRGCTRARVTAVTASAGKTTLKEMIASILEQELSVAKNYKNFNNQLGLPLSILKTDGTEDAWVLEAGISREGDMEELGVILRPDIAVVLNIAPAHLEGLGDLHGVAKAKATLLRYLADDGIALVSIDYPELVDEAEKLVPDFVTLSSQDEKADYYCKSVRSTNEGCVFDIKTPVDRWELTLPVCSHYAENIAAAVAVADLYGISRESINKGLMQPCGVGQRFDICTVGGFTLIDDSYNANPLSMQKAIAGAQDKAVDSPLYLVLGDMGELGSNTEEAHRDMGKWAAESACDIFYYHGEMTEHVSLGMGLDKCPETFRRVATPDEFLSYWRAAAPKPGVVLFKGSRSSGMERFFSILKKELASGRDAVQQEDSA